METPLLSKQRKRPDLMTISMGEGHEALISFAKKRAEEEGLKGGVSELLQRLLVAESKRKLGIGKHSYKLPRRFV